MIRLVCHGVALEVDCPGDLEDAVRAELIRIPDVSDRAGPGSPLEPPPDYSIEVLPRGDVYDVGERRLRVSRAGERRAFGRDLVLFALRKISVFLQGRGIFSIHASAVAHRGRACLFSGRSGSGKSTLALALADPAVGQLAANHVLLQVRSGRVEVVGGCRFARLRLGTLVHDFPAFAPLVESSASRDPSVAVPDDGPDPWHRYAMLDAERLPGRPRSFPCTLAEVFLPTRVPGAVRECPVRGSDFFEALFPEVSVFFRPSYFSTHRRLIPSFDSDPLLRERVTFVETLEDLVPCTSISGELPAMVELIRSRGWWQGREDA